MHFPVSGSAFVFFKALSLLQKSILMKKMYAIVLLVLCTFWVGSSVFAQKIKFHTGSKADLKEIKELYVEYDYSELSVGKFDKESDYIAKKKKDYNEKEAGKGNSWERAWKNDRAKRFHPQFEELFIKHSGVALKQGAAYKMIVKTTFVEPGYNIAISRKNAAVSGEIWIVDAADPSKVLIRATFENAPGRSFGGNDYDTGERIQEAYAMLGKTWGKHFK